mgnify:CR=1 FL=1
MDKRISEFIADYIPKRITKETGYKLQYELESHIYDRIDYYTEIGYSEEESLEKALKDFGDDKETKEQIKNEMSALHQPYTLADLFTVSIPITVAMIFIGSGLLNFLLKDHGIKNLVIIPLMIWLVIIALKRAKRIHHIVKSVIAFVLVVPYFGFMLTGYFFWSTNFYTNFNKKAVIEDYRAFITDEYMNEKNHILLPASDEIGNPIDASLFELIENSAFTDPCYYSWIFKYTPEEYEELKEKYDDEFIYRYGYVEYDGHYEDDGEKYIEETYIYNCNFNVYGFNFKTIQTPGYAPELWALEWNNDDWKDDYIEHDYWAFIGTNDETCEIAFIFLYPEGFTPSFDDEFIKEDCGWKYYYIRKWFHKS